MNDLPPDSRAMRRETRIGLTAFFIGFIGMLVTLGWLIVHFVVPETRWWEIVHTGFNAIMISFVFGGMGLSALSLSLVSWYHFRRGIYHCLFCGRTLRSINDHCDCRQHPSER